MTALGSFRFMPSILSFFNTLFVSLAPLEERYVSLLLRYDSIARHNLYSSLSVNLIPSIAFCFASPYELVLIDLSNPINSNHSEFCVL